MAKDSSYVFTDANPEWLSAIVPESYDDAGLHRIVMFYVLHSPCPGLSASGIPVERYGWVNPWRRKEPRQLLWDASSLDEKTFLVSETLGGLEDILKRNKLARASFFMDIVHERVSLYLAKRNMWLALFCHIRNSLAHGRLAMYPYKDEIVFVMEDGVPKSEGFCVTARMVLRKSTLLKWIDILQQGPDQMWMDFDELRKAGSA